MNHSPLTQPSPRVVKSTTVNAQRRAADARATAYFAARAAEQAAIRDAIVAGKLAAQAK